MFVGYSVSLCDDFVYCLLVFDIVSLFWFVGFTLVFTVGMFVVGSFVFRTGVTDVGGLLMLDAID